MKHAEEQSGKSVLVNQFIKFEPSYQYLYESVAQKKYGRLLKVRLLGETAPLWGDLGLGTITTNLMIHDLDFISWLLGATAPSGVWGSQGAQEGQAVVEAIFNKPNVSAQVIASSLMPAAYPFTVGYEAYFERAKLEFH